MISAGNEAPIWSNNRDYLAIASSTNTEQQVKDSENNEPSFVARDKQFLWGVSISWIIEEILKSHACWIQWIEMRMSRYNTSLSPSSPSLSSLSHPGVGDNDNDIAPLTVSSQSNQPITQLRQSGLWSCNISNFKLVSRLKEHPHTPTSLKHVWRLFISWRVYIKWIMEQSI